MKLLHTLFGFVTGKAAGHAASRAGRTGPAEIEQAIESVVNGTEPRIRLVSGYKKKLHAAIATSLDYIDRLVDSIPGPLEVNRNTFASDPQVNAFFVTPQELQTIFSESAELRAFFDNLDNRELDEAYALMCMTETEKTVLGTDLNGDMLRRDVMQTAVNFSEHKILSPAANEAGIRAGVKKCIFDGLVTNALQHIVVLKSQLRELEDQRRILHARLRSRLAQGGGLNSLLAAAKGITPATAEIEEQLAVTVEKLAQMPASKNALLEYLNEVRKVLEQPQDFIRLKLVSMKLTKMCIVASEESVQACNPIRFAEIEIANVLKRVVVIVRYPRDEMLPKQELNSKLHTPVV